MIHKIFNNSLPKYIYQHLPTVSKVTQTYSFLLGLFFTCIQGKKVNKELVSSLFFSPAFKPMRITQRVR